MAAKIPKNIDYGGETEVEYCLAIERNENLETTY
jgi:hypothetical protein